MIDFNNNHAYLCMLSIFIFFGFYTCVFQLSCMSWPSTYVLLDYRGTFCAGGHPNAHFRCCHFGDSNPCSSNLNNKCQRLNNVGHPDPHKVNRSLFEPPSRVWLQYTALEAPPLELIYPEARPRLRGSQNNLFNKWYCTIVMASE